jgi:hypothetical protein
MSMSVGASSNALSYLQSLLAQGTAGASDPVAASNPLSPLLQALSGFGAANEQPTPATAPANANVTTGSGGPPFDPGMMAALLSLQDQSATGGTTQTSSSLFSKLDTDGDGQISKSEFETALTGAGASTSNADALFAKLDANGDGSISQSELAKASHGHHHHMHGGGGAQGSGSSGQSADSLLSSTDASGATTQTAANADGSSTTTITYADGSTVEMTTPAAANSSGTAAAGASGQNSANLFEQLIQLQSQLLSSIAPTLSAVV